VLVVSQDKWQLVVSKETLKLRGKQAEYAESLRAIGSAEVLELKKGDRAIHVIRLKLQIREIRGIRERESREEGFADNMLKPGLQNAEMV
jgi:hypothetical protein